MQKKTIRTFTLGLAAAALLVSVAFAQGPGGPGGHGPGGHGSMLDHLVTALNLTAAQKATATQLHSDMVTKSMPLMQQSHQQWTELHTLLDGANPDATELGQKLIAAHATETQLKALHDNFVTQLSAILTADQKATLTQMEQKHQQMNADGPHGPAGM
jgi:Spy/CpxP family protein refolding chaperone